MFYGFLDTTPVQAQQNISFRDLDGDGTPDLAVIRASFYTKLDKIMVFDKNNDMKISQSWEECCDFLNDIWVFDAGGDGKAELVIDFDDKEKLTAYIYDDSDGDSKVSYSISNNITILENKFVIKIEARNNRWVYNNKPDFEVDIFLNRTKPVLNSYYDMDKDGIVDLKVTDKGSGGGWFEAGKDGYIRYGKVDSKFYSNYLYWPLLNTLIISDWKKAKVKFRELLPRFKEGSYDVWLMEDKLNRYKTKQIRYGLESPFAYYDLNGKRSIGLPDMIIRLVDFYEYETESEKKEGKRFYEEARYTWNQGKHGWYRIAFYGKNEYDSIVEYPIGPVKHVPYSEVPYWTLNHSWFAAIFASDEFNQKVSGEGLYQARWSHVHFLNKYMNSSYKLPKYIPNRVGDREEIALNPATNELYYSPIDRRLHLKGAQEGIWILAVDKKISNPWGYGWEIRTGKMKIIEKIEYENLDGDDYLDKWTYYVNDKPVKHLIYSNGFLIYSDKEKIRILKAGIKQSLFEIMPPRSPREWAEVGKKLDAVNNRRIDGKDFEGMFNQFRGEVITIEGGFIKDFNLTEVGFRVSLDCMPQCIVEPSSAIEYEGPLRLGKYILSYDGRFRITKSVVPDLIIRDIDISLSKENPREIEYVTISARVHNTGKEEVGPVVVQFFDGEPQNGTLIGRKTLARIQPGKSSIASQPWLAKLGVKEIYVVVDPDDLILEIDERNNVAARDIYVSPLKQPPVIERLKIGVNSENLPSIFALFLGILFLAVYLSKSLFEGDKG
jgi:hypothetical protein